MLVQIHTEQEVEAVVEKQEQAELKNLQYHHQNVDQDEALEKANADVKVAAFCPGSESGTQTNPCPMRFRKKYKHMSTASSVDSIANVRLVLPTPG
jgi:hypothetical protein